MSTSALAGIIQNMQLDLRLRYGPAASDPKQTLAVLTPVERIEPAPEITPEFEAAE